LTPLFTSKPTDEEVEAAILIRNKNFKALGFTPKAFYYVCRNRGEMLYAFALTKSKSPIVLGFCLFHIRRDHQMTIYEIAIDQAHRGKGFGKAMVEELKRLAAEKGVTCIFAKCPVELPSNAFYASAGFTKGIPLAGSKRALNSWSLRLRTGLFAKEEGR
jgi:ribosomal protein S18 acetylase RimI-like enzyme